MILRQALMQSIVSVVLTGCWVQSQHWQEQVGAQSKALRRKACFPAKRSADYEGGSVAYGLRPTTTTVIILMSNQMRPPSQAAVRWHAFGLHRPGFAGSDHVASAPCPGVTRFRVTLRCPGSFNITAYCRTAYGCSVSDYCRELK